MFCFCMFFPPECVSYRQREHGSFLIQFIVDVFNKHAHKDDIEELFRKVSFVRATVLWIRNIPV